MRGAAGCGSLAAMIGSILAAALAISTLGAPDPPSRTLRGALVTSVAPSPCSSGVLACYARITVSAKDQPSQDLFLIAEPNGRLPEPGATCDFEVQRGLVGGGQGDRLPRSADRLEIQAISCAAAAPGR